MKNRSHLLIAAWSVLMLSCMLPGMIPLTQEPQGPMPYMEADPQKVLEVLEGGQANALESLAPEQYTEDDLAKPGTRTYTVRITDDKPTFLIYGWCAVDEATLQ